MNKTIALCTLSIVCCYSAYATDMQTDATPVITNFAETKKAEPGKLHKLEDLLNKRNATQAFNDLIASGNVVIDFSASWCGPCRRLEPALKDLAKEFGNVIFVKVDVDRFSSISNRYNIRSIPCMIFFRDGKKIDTVTGFGGKGALRTRLQKHY